MAGKPYNSKCFLRHFKARRRSPFLFVAVLSLNLTATAQESPYSADALMTAYKTGQNPPKGAEITFHDVVTEVRRTSLTFRSSEKDRVICELASSLDRAPEQPVLGRPVTVVGRVRGRGVLGNVTLDQCTLAASIVAVNAPAPLEPIIDVAEELVEEADVPAEPTPQTPAIRATATVTSTHAKETALPKRASLDPPQPPSQTQEAREQSHAVSECAEPPRAAFPYGSHLVSLFAGIAGVLAFGKLRRVAASRPKADGNSPAEVRRAALEALLSRGKKKN
jgi:hypothetical protein